MFSRFNRLVHKPITFLILVLIALPCLGKDQPGSTVGKVVQKAEEVKPLTVGEKLPNISLLTPEGKEVALTKIVEGKPTVLIFYRGGWCPYCNQHLSQLKDVETQLKDMGVQIVAISPDLPSNLKDTVAKQELGYMLLSDKKAEAMKAFGIAFKVDDETFDKYKNSYGLDLEKWSGEEHHILPVPSVFLSDSTGKIKYVYFNPNYQTRLKNEELLKAVAEVLKEKEQPEDQ